MIDKTPLTAEEAAKILKISKYTLYELVKKGDISAQHVGRQLRFDPDVLSRNIGGGKSQSGSASPISAENLVIFDTDMIRFAGSNDPAVEMLVQFAQHAVPKLTIETQYIGSMEGLFALYRRQTAIVGAHLWDESTGEYNLPYVKYILPGEAVTVVNLVKRVQGWMVPAGNPLELTTWNDIVRPGLRFINRQKGSGTRLRIDAFLRQAGISHAAIRGYDTVETTHFGVACKIANGEADAGIGVQVMATRLGLDFVPLFEENYDLITLQEFTNRQEWNHIISILNTLSFHKALNSQLGYNTSLTGKVVFQN